MSQHPDNRLQLHHLQNQNEYLKSQLEEYKFRQKILKKQLQIMNELTCQRSSPSEAGSHQACQDQIHSLNAQIIQLNRQKQKLQILNLTYLQNINDLRFNNGELKKLSQKISRVHEKQIQIMKKQALPNDYLIRQQRQKRLIKDNQVLHKKLDSCGEIAKEMQQYYLNEIKKLKQITKRQQEQNKMLSRELQGTKTQRMSQASNDMMRSYNEKWQKQMNLMKQDYQAQIKKLKNKIQFLIDKIQNDNIENYPIKVSLGSISSEKMSQSKILQPASMQCKMIQSTSITQSAKFTPTSSVSSYKDFPTRRNNSKIKYSIEGIQCQKSSKGNKGPLVDRFNF